jgi:hypothetical protein
VTIYRYVLQPLNIIDLVAIVPFYIELSTDSGSSLSIIRILRLARVIRLVKSGKGRFTKGLKILGNTLVSSAPMNAFLLAIALIIFVICGAIGYLLEGGVFHVTEEHPEGAYMRTNLYGTHLEPTPFLSVLHGMYWSIVTSTTVGYGDFHPTTWGGRVFACACTFLGIVVIALPVTVLGNHFGKEYEREYTEADGIYEDDNSPDMAASRRGSFGSEMSFARKNSFGNNNQSFLIDNSPMNLDREGSLDIGGLDLPISTMSPAGSVGSRPILRSPSIGSNSGSSRKLNWAKSTGDVAARGSPLVGRHKSRRSLAVPIPVRGNNNTDINDAEKAAVAIRRLEEMATDLQNVIRSMKTELGMHTETLKIPPVTAHDELEEANNEIKTKAIDTAPPGRCSAVLGVATATEESLEEDGGRVGVGVGTGTGAQSKGGPSLGGVFMAPHPNPYPASTAGTGTGAGEGTGVGAEAGAGTGTGVGAEAGAGAPVMSLFLASGDLADSFSL